MSRRLLEISIDLANVEVGKRETFFPVINHLAETAGEEIETPANGLDQIRIETVETDKLFIFELSGFIDLLAHQDRAAMRTVEENHPVAGDFRMAGGDEIDFLASLRSIALAPNSNRIDGLGNRAVPFFMNLEVLQILERRDQFPLAGLHRNVLDGVAQRKNQRRGKQVMYVAFRNGDFLSQRGLLLFRRVAETHGQRQTLQRFGMFFNIVTKLFKSSAFARRNGNHT